MASLQDKFFAAVHGNNLALVRSHYDVHIDEGGIDIDHLHPTESIPGGLTALQESCFSENFEIAKFLLEEAGADVHAGQVDVYTPLATAVSTRNLELVTYLLLQTDANTGINAASPGRDNGTLAILATDRYNSAVANYIQNTDGPVLDIANLREVEILRLLIIAGMDVDLFFSGIPLSLIREEEQNDRPHERFVADSFRVMTQLIESRMSIAIPQRIFPDHRSPGWNIGPSVRFNASLDAQQQHGATAMLQALDQSTRMNMHVCFIVMGYLSLDDIPRT